MITVWPNPAVTRSSRSRDAMPAVSEINFAHTRIGRDLLRRSLHENRALHQDGNLLGKTEDQIHVVIDKQHGDLLRQSRDDVEDDMTLRGRNSGGGLVEQQDFWTQRQRNGDLEETLAAIGQLLRGDARHVAQADAMNQFIDAFDLRTMTEDRTQQLAGNSLALRDREKHIFRAPSFWETTT